MNATTGKQTISPRAILWDLDGTLVDTAAQHWKSWQAEMIALGRPLREDEFSITFGQRNDTILRIWLTPDLSDEEVKQISSSKEARYRKSLQQDPLMLLPGVLEWLKRLRGAGWRQAVATMTCRENLEAILNVLPVREYFDALATEEDAQHGKPEPDIFLCAAEKLGVPARRCVVIEDSPAGVEAARRAGMRSIGVHPVNRLAADFWFPSLDQIPPDLFDNLIN